MEEGPPLPHGATTPQDPPGRPEPLTPAEVAERARRDPYAFARILYVGEHGTEFSIHHRARIGRRWADAPIDEATHRVFVLPNGANIRHTFRPGDSRSLQNVTLKRQLERAMRERTKRPTERVKVSEGRGRRWG